MKTTLATILTAFLATSAFAGDVGSLQHLSFEEVKEACANPARYHNQTAPSNIQIACTEVKTKWIPVENKAQTKAQTMHEVSCSLLSDKYVVDAFTQPIAAEAQNMACASYKEVKENVQTARAVTCADLLAYKGNAVEFCSSAVGAMRTANPDAVAQQDTGRVFNTCSQQAPSADIE